MNTNPLKQGDLTENSAGIGTVTHKTVRGRAMELTDINGCSAQDILKSDIIQEMQRHAKICETVAQDMTEEALTGASCDKEKNTQEAKEWMLKSQVWLEAEAVVRGFV